MTRLSTILVTLVAAAALTGAALAECGDGWMARNLVATPEVKAALRSAYLAAHPGARVGGPAPGRTYYGDYSGTRWAIATFGSHPTIFRTDRHGRWQVRKQTRGGICTDVVPVELVKAWWLEHRAGRCYAEPS